ncbi:MAG TPA: hypothetical protein VNA31_01225, partial [bacterium]|nr:hypothetical protein [bacterium]
LPGVAEPQRPAPFSHRLDRKKNEGHVSRAAARYPQCRGKEHWDVREYVRHTGVGAREYRVVRGSSIEDVYRSAGRVRAAAVGTALNKLESQERSGKAPGGSA